MRHCAVSVKGDYLYIFYTVVGDNPESILMCKIKMDDDVNNWEILSTETILKPELGYEGSKLPLVPSSFGSADYPMNQVRDPYVFIDGKESYLLYSFAGEVGIGLAKLNRIED